MKRTTGGSSTYSVYDGDDLLMEISGSGALVREYAHFPGIDQPHSMKDASGNVYHYAMELPGHVKGLFNAANQVVNEYSYDPWGEMTAVTEAVQQPLRYMARELDPITGLYYVRNRWYDPVANRFVSEDPIGLEGGINTYAYALNSPTNLRDPSGLNPEGDICADLGSRIADPGDQRDFIAACRRALRLPGITATATAPNPFGFLDGLMAKTNSFMESILPGSRITLGDLALCGATAGQSCWQAQATRKQTSEWLQENRINADPQLNTATPIRRLFPGEELRSEAGAPHHDGPRRLPAPRPASALCRRHGRGHTEQHDRYGDRALGRELRLGSILWRRLR